MVQQGARRISRDLQRTVSLWLLGFDVVIAIPAAGIAVAIHEIVDVGAAMALFGALMLVRMLIWSGYLRWKLRPMQAWTRLGERSSDAELHSADVVLGTFTVPLSSVYALTWMIYFVGGTLLAYFALPSVMLVGRGELISTLVIAAAVTCGAPMVAYPVADLLGMRVRAELGLEFERRGLVSRHAATPMLHRLGGMAVNLALAPMFVMMALAWNAQLQGLREGALARAHAHAYVRVAQVEGGELLGPDESIVSDEQLSVVLGRAPAERGATQALDVRSEHARVAWPLSDGRWLLVERDIDLLGGGFWLGIAAVASAVLLWSLFVIFAMVSSITGPIERLRAAVHRVVEVGDLSALGRVPVLREDELGQFTADFNLLLDELRKLAATTQRVAKGELGVELEGRGELVESFRSMVEQLHEIIVDIRGLAVGVVSAAHEIEAATREQELASVQQDHRLQDLRALMGSLAHSAAQIDGAANDVYGNAERTLATTDDMAVQLRELDTHSRGIAELLESIREVADRSDLLALNGALEATRAGEAGRGFALVAGEMRRLAERVTATVGNVQRLVGEMTRASERTGSATVRSHSLAAATTATARTISDETRRQTHDTEDASTRVAEVADLASQTSTATVQTRAAAQDLRERAGELERSTARFALRESASGRRGPAR